MNRVLLLRLLQVSRITTAVDRKLYASQWAARAKVYKQLLPEEVVTEKFPPQFELNINSCLLVSFVLHSPWLDRVMFWLFSQAVTLITQLLGYVLPSEPHTGTNSSVHGVGGHTHTAPIDVSIHVCCGWLHLDFLHGSGSVECNTYLSNVLKGLWHGKVKRREEEPRFFEVWQNRFL